MRLNKCYGEECEKENRKYPKEQLQEISSKNYCPTCYPVVLQETTDRNNLYAQVKEIFSGNGFSSVERLVQTQIKKFRNEGMKYKGMSFTLHYMVAIENIEFDNRGVALLPYYYDKAKDWYVKQKDMQEQTKGFEIKETKVVVSVGRSTNKYKESKILGMEGL